MWLLSYLCFFTQQSDVLLHASDRSTKEGTTRADLARSVFRHFDFGILALLTLDVLSNETMHSYAM